MAKKQIVINFVPMRIDSGSDVGVSPRVDYLMVEPGAGGGFDLFDVHMLAFVKEHFIKMNESRFTFTIEPAGMPQFSRVFAESKFEK
jgi:hypothetical protein